MFSSAPASTLPVNPQAMGGLAAPSAAGVSATVAAATALPAVADASVVKTETSIIVPAILRGQIIPGSDLVPQAPPESYCYTGRWSISATVEQSFDFRYNFMFPADYMPPVPTVPVRHTKFPSAPDHPPVTVPLTGYFKWLLPDTKKKNQLVDKTIEEGSSAAWKVIVTIGGAVTPTAPASVTGPDGTVYPASQCIGFNGEGTNRFGHYSLAGTYHPGTGTLWVHKAYIPKAAGAAAAPAAASRAGQGARSSLGGVSATSGADGVPVERPRRVFSEDMKMCLEALSRLNKEANANIFGTAVDPIKHDAPGYFDRIKRPMDLGTVMHNLRGNLYPTQQAFIDDVNLTFDNATTYNASPDHWIHRAAKELKARFHDIWEKLTTEKSLAPEDRAKRKSTAGLDGLGSGGSALSGRKRSASRRDEDAHYDSEDAEVDEGDDDGAESTGKARKSLGGPGPAKKARKSVSSTAATALPAVDVAGTSTDVSALRQSISDLTKIVTVLVSASAQQAGGATVPLANLAAAGVDPSLFASVLGGGALAAAPAPSAKTASAKRTPSTVRRKSEASEKSVKGSRQSTGGQPRTAATRGSAAAAPATPVTAPIIGTLVPLTYDEKQKLSEDVGRLQPEEVDRVLQIVAERVVLDQPGSGEVELDMDTLDTATLRELQGFVAQCLQSQAPPAPAVIPAPAEVASRTRVLIKKPIIMLN